MHNTFLPILLLVSTLMLGACSGLFGENEVDDLNKAEFVGSPFTQILAQEYRAFANSEENSFFDYADALHFARKGLASANGDIVLPEPLENWSLDTAEMATLEAARLRLLDAFDNGAREIAPKASAIAQARFDCWIEQQEEDWHSFIDGDSISCRSAFENAMRTVEEKLAKTEPEEGAPVVKKVEMKPLKMAKTLPLDEAKYFIFFDFDSSKISAGADAVVDAIATEVNNRSDVSQVVIVGHTDSSGSAAYNARLAERRANSVMKALSNLGVSGGMLMTESRGENDLLVKTKNNTREPANRRVEITFR